MATDLAPVVADGPGGELESTPNSAAVGKHRGSSLAPALMAGSVALMLLLSLGQAVVYQHHFVLLEDDREQAQNLASGVLHQAIAELVGNEGFRQPCSWSLPGPRQPNQATLTFQPGQSTPHSSNNLGGGSTLRGPNGRPVPPGTAHLIARARYGHADLSWECLYYRPPFPRGVISSGPVDLEGSQVLGLVPEAAYAGQWSLVPNSERTPSHVFANGTGPGALRLGPRTEVSGNAATCGGLDLDPAAQVGGEVQAHAAPQEVPAFDIPEMITRVGSAAGLHPFHPALPVNDFMTALSSVNVNHDLVLDGGTLAVRGNLTVQGAVRGRGVLLVDGNVTLRGGSSFEADRQVALLATGNVDLVGPGQDYYFQGLLYSQGQLTARQLSVLGSVVCNSSNPAHRVELENVRLITTPIHVQTRYGMPTIESVADDTIRFYLSCTPDPLRPDQMLFYGKGDYCEAYDYDTSREPVHLRVYFNPGEAVWTVDGNIVDRHPYDGKRASIEAELGRLITYYGENAGGAPGRVSRYLDALVAGSQQDQYLEINLNQVIRPVERARILYWGPLRQH